MPTLTILLVDDDPLMHRMLVPRLERLDVRPPVGSIVSASTPREALAALDQVGAGPVAVLSDFNLKAEMTGLQLLRVVRERRADTVRLLFSGYSSEQIGDVLEGGDAHGFVEKPLHVDEMMPAIASLIRTQLDEPGLA